MSGANNKTTANGLPRELAQLLNPNGGDLNGEAWACFLESHSKLILKAAHTTSDGYDDAMDRYAFVISHLQEEDFRRLRAFTPNGRGKFSTWLVVVASRLCEDFRRARYGRPRPGADDDGVTPEVRQAFKTRQRLVDLVAEELDPALHADPNSNGAEMEMRRGELTQALAQSIGVLEPRDRLLFKLRFQDGLSAREIAEIMAFSNAFQVYRRIKAQLGVLRESLEHKGITDSRP